MGDAVALVLSPGCLPLLPSHLSLRQLGLDSLVENLGFRFISKIQTDLGVISFKCVKVWSRSLVPGYKYQLLNSIGISDKGS